MCLSFLVSLPLLLLALLAISFQQGSAGLTSTTAPSSASAASSQSTRPSSPSFVAAIRQPAAESRPLAAAAAAAAAAAPALLIKRADPVAENKTEPAKAEPAGARMPKCVRKTRVAGPASTGWFIFRPRPLVWVRTFVVSELEQEGVSDSDLEEKLMLEMLRKCPNMLDWHYFPNKGDGKGATVLFLLKSLLGKKCVEEAFREAGFPKDFKCKRF